MERIAKKTVIIVFSIFTGLTYLLSVTQKLSWTNAVLHLLVLLAVFLLLKFPVLQKWEIKKPRVVFALISMVALVARIIWVNLIFVNPVSDFYTLHTLADALSRGEILYPKYLSLFPHVFGYSRVLSLVYGIFGSSTTVAVYWNILVNMGILLLVYSLGKHFYDEKTGLIAAAIYACWPSQIIYNTLVLTEPVYVFGVLAILRAYLWLSERRCSSYGLYAGFAALGVLAGLLKYIRPASLIVALSVILHFIFLKTNPEQKGVRSFLIHRIGPSALLLVVYSITALVALNGIEKRIDIEVAKQAGGFNLYVGMNTTSKGKWSADDSALLQQLIDEGLSSPEIQDAFTTRGIERIKEMDLWAHIKHQVNKNRVMWGDDSAGIGYNQLGLSPKSHIQLGKHSSWLSLGSDAYYFVFLLLSLMSVILLKEKLSTKSFTLFLYILGTVAVHMLVEVHGRYHYPVIPMLCVLASAVLTQERFRPEK